MLCQRCRGLLVHETFDGLSQEADMMCLATRCINCGSIEDSVVRANRLHPPAAKRAVPRRMGRVYTEGTMTGASLHARIPATIFLIYGGIRS